MSVKEFARITDQIGQSENMVELYRRQGATGENMKAMADGLAIARSDSSRARGRLLEAQEENVTLALENQDLQDENEQLKEAVTSARNLLAEMVLRNATFKRTIDHLRTAWKPEAAAEISAIEAQKDKEVRSDPEFQQKVSDFVMEKTTPTKKKTTGGPR